MSTLHPATDSRINLYGRWHLSKTATTINSGALVEFAYTGSACTLLFDVENLTFFPAIFVQIDNGPISATTLSASHYEVQLQPEFDSPPKGPAPYPKVSSTHHLVRFWVATHSLYQTAAAGTQWRNLDGGCKFAGVRISNGCIIRLPYLARQIEFLGDSITQGLRLLYTGQDDDTGLQQPYRNWPQLVADLLGVRPIVNGFGGQGLSTHGTCGVPGAAESFKFVYDSVPWQPAVKPLAVVIYHGVNDAISSAGFETRYSAYLDIVSQAYPDAHLFAVCPHGKENYASAIRAASGRIPNASFLDYSSDILSMAETCDGCHLNPGGAVKLATTMAADIQFSL